MHARCIDDLPLRRHDVEEIESAQTVAGFPITGSGLRELSAALERTAIVVETRWKDIPGVIRRVLELSVYAPMARGLSPKTIGLYAKCLIILIQIAGRGDITALGLYARARSRYQRAVLDAIERDEKSYQDVVAESLKNLPSSGKDAISASDYIRRIRALSDTAV